jgi:hypothetical protein
MVLKVEFRFPGFGFRLEVLSLGERLKGENSKPKKRTITQIKEG